MSKRSLWEFDISIRLHAISHYIELLQIKSDTIEHQKYSMIYGEDIHQWTMKHIISVSQKIKEIHKDNPVARVKLSQEHLDEIEKLTGIKAISYDDTQPS